MNRRISMIFSVDLEDRLKRLARQISYSEDHTVTWVAILHRAARELLEREESKRGE